MVQTSMTVEETIRRWPAAIAVFQRHRMHCVGCPMSRFDTLADSATTYGLEPEALAAEIARTVHPTQGAQNR